jgi:hypothetical protein
MPISTICTECDGEVFLIPDIIINDKDNYEKTFRANCKCGRSYAGTVKVVPGYLCSDITIKVDSYNTLDYHADWHETD